MCLTRNGVSPFVISREMNFDVKVVIVVVVVVVAPNVVVIVVAAAAVAVGRWSILFAVLT